MQVSSYDHEDVSCHMSGKSRVNSYDTNDLAISFCLDILSSPVVYCTTILSIPVRILILK